MVKHLVGESIECDKCELVTRKIVPSSLQMHHILGRVMKYDCSRNCSAKNLKELNPKKFRVKMTSDLDLNTLLSAESIFLFTTKLRPLKLNVVNESGRHKANEGVVDGFTFAEIKYPMENVLNAIAKRKELSSKKSPD
ncbi:hypothetical protein [Runella sp.]|jgi:hypothetical protein|uniref:hypothetical protein n=1 Tax=Runella sp. TaxID=1960881 RepID=UPI0026329BBA|nr:hypothetical protein [Runella sp.]